MEDTRKSLARSWTHSHSHFDSLSSHLSSSVQWTKPMETRHAISSRGRRDLQHRDRERVFECVRVRFACYVRWLAQERFMAACRCQMSLGPRFGRELATSRQLPLRFVCLFVYLCGCGRLRNVTLELASDGRRF